MTNNNKHISFIFDSISFIAKVLIGLYKVEEDLTSHLRCYLE